jgi:hypothetical protein
LLVIFGLVIFIIFLRDFFLYSAMCHCPLSLSPLLPSILISCCVSLCLCTCTTLYRTYILRILINTREIDRDFCRSEMTFRLPWSWFAPKSWISCVSNHLILLTSIRGTQSIKSH